MIDMEYKEGIAKVTLNRPEKLNALNLQMRLKLIETLRSINSSRDIRVVVITGKGRGFCAGADITGEDISNIDLGKDLEGTFYPILREIKFSKKIYISYVNGVAAGAGFSLALACDLRFSSKNAKFVTAFHRISLVPDTALALMLLRLIGVKGNQLILLGGELSAEEAEQLGLFKILEKEEEAISMAMKISRGPFLAYSKSKELINKALFQDLEEFLKLESSIQREMGKSHDFREGINAFAEKREPKFIGE
jgi:enoyl-CoA hydratase/carnithine racemase